MIQMNPKLKDALEWAACIVVAVVLALIIRYYIGTPTVVENSSMYPTLIDGQRLILNRMARTFSDTYERGDIVTLEAPSISRITSYDASEKQPIAAYYESKNIFERFSYYVLEINKTSYIKRVIGLPGEHVKIDDGKVYINDKLLDEPYLQDGIITPESGAFYDLIVPEKTLFLMGDNREKSMDSRSFGCVPYSKIESKVWIRFWPFNLFGKVD